MALEYSFSISEADNSKALYIFDGTGAYEGFTNPTGYGGPNVSIGDVTTATLTISFPDPTITPVVKDIYSTTMPEYPTTSAIPVTVTNVMLGIDVDTNLDDGVYFFESTITGIKSAVPFTYSDSKYVVFSNQVEAYFDSLTCSLIAPTKGCGCTDSYQLERLKNLLRSARCAACSGEIQNAIDIMNYLIKIAGCNNNPLTIC